jgi:hypothetical protein
MAPKMATPATDMWLKLNPLGRQKLDEQLRGLCAEHAERNEQEITTRSPWATALLSVLRDVAPTTKMIVVCFPLRQGRKTSVDHADARAVLPRIMDWLSAKTVAEHGHRSVNSVERFASQSDKRTRDQYGFPIAAPFKLRIVNAMNNTVTSRRFFLCRPYEEADLTVIFSRAFPKPEIKEAMSIENVEFVRISFVTSRGDYRVEKQNVVPAIYTAVEASCLSPLGDSSSSSSSSSSKPPSPRDQKNNNNNNKKKKEKNTKRSRPDDDDDAAADDGETTKRSRKTKKQ